ncbi:Phosphoglucomutase and phosphomannomutase phosphoserine signature [Nakaseomyces glabratus]|nr:Phosphoglucomutase and phosphomannomutase phosphoserine signature [Nakaseomyces glabratus]KAH7580033.1 Phosphoglucomutase and phosphomannomutase phosphoserine signature [Nakaseomyces glabratus]
MSTTDIPVELRTAIESWLQLDKNEETRNEVIKLCNDQNWDELHKRFDSRIVFGTAGLRARMEAGTNRLNKLVILQASQGLATYIKDKFPQNLTAVVGHDHRYHSQEFAQVTAATFIRAGFKVYYLNPHDEFVHTPMVPYSVDHLNASVGVMITASHNPKMDNGYKVYYANGCQIIPPHDHGIAETINNNLEPWSTDWNFTKILSNAETDGKIEYVRKRMLTSYLNSVVNQLIQRDFAAPDEKPWFVYTPMHGVGHQIFSTILNESLNLKDNIDYITVPEQKDPDPSFRTVSFPNPEEKGALNLAITLAEANGIKLVLANDPDADRFSVAVRDDSKNEWKQLTGNEIGLLFAFYEFKMYQKAADKGIKNKPLAMLNSTVSAQVIKRMAEKEGFLYKDTLTGFKWIGNEAAKLEEKGYFVPFGYEEAIGYMFPALEHDKDGVSAAIVFLQAYANWLQSSSNPIDIIHECYDKYGVSAEYNGYYIVSDPSKTDKVFESIRSSYTSMGLSFPESIGEHFRVTEFRDLTIGFDSTTADKKPLLPVDKNSQMITITAVPSGASNTGESVRFTIRGSGTEPKLKVYIEGISSTEGRARILAKSLWETLKLEWFKPSSNGLSTDF